VFGPNYSSDSYFKTEFSHRSEEFKKLYSSLTFLLQEKFNLKNYDIIPIAGSGTTAMEAVIYSIKDKLNVIGVDGKFKDRWYNLSCALNKIDTRGTEVYCHLETSKSQIFDKESCIVDGISSFPYYDIPNNTKIFVTCGNKQLGGHPGLSFIFVRKDCWNLIREDELFVTNNLSLHKKYSLNYQTPTTCPVQLYSQVYDTIKLFDFTSERERINHNSDLVCDLVGEHLVGLKRCPVITFKKEAMPHWIAQKYRIYNYNNNSDYYQIFTYSAPQQEYYNLYMDFKNDRS